MAVSGRKPPNLSESVLKSSAEDFDHKCEPCFSENQVVEATAFCVNCQEYLCKSCFNFHRKTSALKHHELLDEVSMMTAGASAKRDRTTSFTEVFTERCSVHKNEFIKFFCPLHETLGCTDCMTLNHRTCEIDYIPDKCTGIEEGEEYTGLMRNLDQRLKKTDLIMKKAEHMDRYIETQCESVKNEVAKQRKTIDENLDKMQKKIYEITETRMSHDKIVLKEAIGICCDTSRDVKKLQFELEENKASKRKMQLYINIKQAKDKLKANDIQQAHNSLQRIDVQYKFKGNKDFEKQIGKMNALGEVIFQSTTSGNTKHPIKPSQEKINFQYKLKSEDEPRTLTGHMNTFEEVKLQTNISRKERFQKCLTYIDNINIKTASDKAFFKCNIIGCAFLSSNKIVLIDGDKNQKIKVVDIDNKNVIEEKVMDPSPSGIAALPSNQIAVTVPKKKEILIMAVSNEISILRTIKLGKECRSITYGQYRLYVLCNNPNCILILDMQGKILKKLSLNRKLTGQTRCIVYSTDTDMLYIYEYLDAININSSKKVVRLNLEGIITAEFRIASTVADMVLLDDGSLLICANLCPNFYRLSKDLDECYAVDIDVSYTYSVCYSSKLGKIYTGSYSSDLLKICKVEL